MDQIKKGWYQLWHPAPAPVPGPRSLTWSDGVYTSEFADVDPSSPIVVAGEFLVDKISPHPKLPSSHLLTWSGYKEMKPLMISPIPKSHYPSGFFCPAIDFFHVPVSLKCTQKHSKEAYIWFWNHTERPLSSNPMSCSTAAWSSLPARAAGHFLCIARAWKLLPAQMAKQSIEPPPQLVCAPWHPFVPAATCKQHQLSPEVCLEGCNPLLWTTPK